ncbi:hypothetical protein LBW60_03030 [Ralstonia solanacearum]|uniref:hypothetical protein n=1 Tax=Ralstonia solanacearum TaxID=305 RepID=UPI0023058645|nr:hypothetical protein [Ralstonia solanacearum]MDB0508046.1 hypothetical protein [Ralstonia solanacearum]MDB0512315.1 hypothetical protein [Ralstonia solanacearum]
MIRIRAWTFLIMAVAGFGLCAWLVRKIVLAHAVLAEPFPMLPILALVACALLMGACLSSGMAFLFFRRVVTEIRHDGPELILVLASGQSLVPAESVRVIKRIGNLYEYPVPQKDLFTIFSAGSRWWVCRTATFSAATSTEASPSS